MGNSQVGECLFGLCHQGWRLLTEEPPRALHEVERLTRNPEKLANAGGRGWKDTLGRKRSFRTHRPPYPTRSGLVTSWQETKKLLQDESGQKRQGGPEGENYRKLPGLVKRPKTKKKSGGVLWEPHRQHSRWRKDKKRPETIYDVYFYCIKQLLSI